MPLFIMANFYSIFQPSVFNFLKNGADHPDGPFVEGKDWCNEALTYEFNETAADFGCRVSLSSRRLEQARALWLDDISRIRLSPPTYDPVPKKEDAVPDHFKQAGYLAYWLRRRVVTKKIYELDTSAPTDMQKTFLLYGNEICAFLMGFHICLCFETRHLSVEERKAAYDDLTLDQNLLTETSKLLHHKNVSPQSLYLIYRSLFYRLLPTGSASGNAIRFDSENVLEFRRQRNG